VRSLGGTVTLRDQALQAAGKRDNGAALIEVIADKNLIVASPSALDGQHVPTLSTAASPVNNVGKGGLNVLQACDGNVRVEAGAQVVATGKSTPGRNEVTADNGTVTILGKVDPSPVAGAGCENPAPIW
jgi:hypothetical protein